MDETIARLHEQFLRQIDLWQKETSLIQQDLLALYKSKKSDLTRGHFENMSSLLEREQSLLTRYAQQHQQRDKLLDLLRQLDRDVTTLTGWLKTILHDDAPRLLTALQKVQNDNLILRQACWAMWILANRSQHLYGEMIELITFAGKKAPTYDQDLSPRHSASSFLDASA